MALIKCQECGKEISDKAVACIHCGCPLSENVIEIQHDKTDDNIMIDKECGENMMEDSEVKEERSLQSYSYEFDESSKLKKPEKEKNKKEKVKLSKRTWFVILMLVLFWPVGLFLMWKNKKFNKIVRIIVTAIIVLPIIISLLPCSHEWEEANCITPKTCKLCAEEEGEALGHEWKEATCTSPKTCTVCGETDGTELGHEVAEWVVEKESTCIEEGTQKGKCLLCGEEFSDVIEKAEHEAGDWKVSKKATATDSGKKVKKCKVCDEVLDSKSYELSAKEKKQLFKKECKTYSYDKIARNPDKYDGKKAKFTGEVIQVIEDGDDYTLRVNITKGTYYWDDTILVSYTKRSDKEPRILEDDIITMYGTLAGTYTYETVMGSSLTVPLFYAEYVDFK